MAEAERLQLQLLRAQNADGGWGYGSGSSWTEPTAFAVLALESHETASGPCARGREWLRARQLPDGAWPPNPNVRIGTWVTSLAILALVEESAQPPIARAIQWTVSEINANTTLLEKITHRLTRVPKSEDTAGGLPWYPNTKSWIAPTAAAVLALSAAAIQTRDESLRHHAELAKRYILSRRCSDHGWNHGGTSYRSPNASSYPEMTGMALLALSGISDAELQQSIARAEEFLENPGSMEGLSWLQMGLITRNRNRLDVSAAFPCRTTRDVSLRLLALGAMSASNRLIPRFC